MKLTARSRLETYASLSRIQSDEETYGLLERVANHAGDSAGRGERAGADGARRADVADVEHAARKGRMEMSYPSPSGYLVQMTSERNPPHGWAVHLLHGEHEDGAVPFYLGGAVEALRKECERAWREVDFISKERTEHLEWRTKLANDLDECERMRDAIGRTLNKRENDLMEALNALGQIVTMADRTIGLCASEQDDCLAKISDLARKIALR